MSSRTKGRISAILLVVFLSTNAAIAAPRRDAGSPGGVLAQLIHLVKKLLPSPMDDPQYPHP
ncbi:MAG TPA: hypothetical protein VLC46_20345 [Thermoanaerobaculia bacterium]|jgi:hypothetical protein|nr:hypothetical protein [Thermoanaerobaculia bacterium]